MALYRTERKLTWDRSLSLGYWHSGFSAAAHCQPATTAGATADAATDEAASTNTTGDAINTNAANGTGYLPRVLRWLASEYPRASIRIHPHRLPDADSPWPENTFGLNDSGSNGDGDNNSGSNGDASNIGNNNDNNSDSNNGSESVADDFLLVEWPGATDAVWANGAERALRRIWQKNPQTEVLLIGGPEGLPPRAAALAAHYGIGTVDPAALLLKAMHTAAATATTTTAATTQATTNTQATNHHPATDSIASATASSSAPAACGSLNARGHELWAGLLIPRLRDSLRVGPTPDPVSLPPGLWGNRA